MSVGDASAGSITGGWLGTHYYRTGRQPPVRFEATFTSSGGGGSFEGTILDDGYLGEAIVSHGLQTGRIVRFRKTYRRSAVVGRSVVAPVHYLGTLSEDGDSVSGTWKMTFRHHDKLIRGTGRWEARRLWGGGSGEEAVVEERELAPALALR
jgi:hypothetical protein